MFRVFQGLIRPRTKSAIEDSISTQSIPEVVPSVTDEENLDPYELYRGLADPVKEAWKKANILPRAVPPYVFSWPDKLKIDYADFRRTGLRSTEHEAAFKTQREAEKARLLAQSSTNQGSDIEGHPHSCGDVSTGPSTQLLKSETILARTVSVPTSCTQENSL